MSANDEVFVRSVERHEIRFAIALVLCVELLDEVHCEQLPPVIVVSSASTGM